jgi:hypothetical protein
MKWNYSGDPSTSALDETRFIVGDTERDKPQVSDDEVLWALGKCEQDVTCAAVILCRHLSRKYSRLADCSVGEVSRSCSQIAKAYKDRADELEDDAISSGLVIPSFGGLSQAQKQSLLENEDAVQPAFSVGMDDNPGTSTGEDQLTRKLI